MSTDTKVITQHNPKIVQRIGEIQIPDLWHIAEILRRGDAIQAGRCKEAGDMVLSAWRLAHYLKEHIALQIDNTEDFTTEQMQVNYAEYIASNPSPMLSYTEFAESLIAESNDT